LKGLHDSLGGDLTIRFDVFDQAVTLEVVEEILRNVGGESVYKVEFMCHFASAMLDLLCVFLDLFFADAVLEDYDEGWISVINV